MWLGNALCRNSHSPRQRSTFRVNQTPADLRGCNIRVYQSLGRMGSADPAVMLPRLMQATHEESEAARLTMPVLCLVGDGDTLIAPPAVRALAGLLPDSRIVELSGCGHSPYFEDPEAWNLAVRRFLDSL